MVEGGRLERKKREKKWLEKKRKQAGAGGRRHTLFLPPSPPPPFCSSLANENVREKQNGGLQGPNSSAPTLSLTLQSSPFPSIPSILHPSLCPQQSLYSSVFILHPSSTTSLPPLAFMLLLIIALTSLPPSLYLSLQQSLPYWCWPSPLCLGLDGPGDGGVGVVVGDIGGWGWGFGGQMDRV